MAPSRFPAEPDRRCLRGLRWIIDLRTGGLGDVEPHALADVMAEALPGAIRGHERLGARIVERVIVQFRVELRFAERPGELTLLFRSCCPSELRAPLLDVIVGRLESWPG